MRKKSTQKILAEKLRFVGTFTFVDLLGRLISDGFKEILIETNCEYRMNGHCVIVITEI